MLDPPLDRSGDLKRITGCLRSGEIPNVRLEYLRDALNDSSTGLTKSALTGVNKQSVPDCERMFSVGIIDFIQKNCLNEMAILRLVHNWHKASDGRGRDEDTPHLYNKDMLNWILDDCMPWHHENYDFSTIDINRYEHNVTVLYKVMQSRVDSYNSKISFIRA